MDVKCSEFKSGKKWKSAGKNYCDVMLKHHVLKSNFQSHLVQGHGMSTALYLQTCHCALCGRDGRNGFGGGGRPCSGLAEDPESWMFIRNQQRRSRSLLKGTQRLTDGQWAEGRWLFTSSWVRKVSFWSGSKYNSKRQLRSWNTKEEGIWISKIAKSFQQPQLQAPMSYWNSWSSKW